MQLNRTIKYHCIQWIVLIAAYAFLGYKLYSYDGYTDWIIYLNSADSHRFLWLLPSLVLLPLNIFLEACKWYVLIGGICPVSIKDAFRQVCYGQLTSFVTPYKAGDYPGRIGLLLSDRENSAVLWSQLLGIGVLNSMLILIVIIAFGLPAAYSRLLSANVDTSRYIIFFSLIFVIPFLLPFFTKKVRASQLLKGLLYSALRYMVWLIQLFCVLVFCGVDLPYSQMFVCLATYYLLVTVTPSMPVADPAVRGSLLLLILSDYTDATVSVALAAVLVWVLNTLIPTFLGSLISFSKGKTE